MKLTWLRALAASMLMLVLYSCASYNKSLASYYSNLRLQNYEKAQRSLEKNKLIKKNRNALLYNLEMGKVYRLQNDFVSSNTYLNNADAIVESNRKSIGDIAKSNLINPMMQSYRGEDHEQFMMHYYKALNYAALGLAENAVVEARRITLSNNTQNDKFRNKDNRYSNDAFALNLQGMIYEMAGDYNNAFIAYRNSVEVYQKSDNDYYGVKLPAQLEQDLLRSAARAGFTGEVQLYEKIFNKTFIDSADDTGSLILFLEEGQAPVKQENNIFLTATKNGIGSFNYINANGFNTNFNFDYNAYGIGVEKLTDLRTFRLAMPTYVVQYAQPQNIFVSANGNQFAPQFAQNINNIAINVLRQRFVTEMANALARQLTKKLVEKGTEALVESIANSANKKSESDTTETQKEKRKEERNKKAEAAGNVAGFVMNMINSGTEKADTRNWQSLPAFVSYVRIPLLAGENKITINTNGRSQIITVNSKRGLQLIGVVVN